MVATEFEYRHRLWLILAAYAGCYAFYNVDHLNVLYAMVPWNQHVFLKDTVVRVLYFAAALLAAAGAFLLTWAAAYRPAIDAQNLAAFSIGGPFRYVRNPQYIAYFLLLLALGTFQSRLGFPIMIVCETILLVRFAGREELRLASEFGQQFRLYAESVPAFAPSLHPRYPPDGQPPLWNKALWEHAFQWGFVLTLLAFACTLSDPVGYAFGLATLCLPVVQRLTQLLWTCLRHSTALPKP
jgi:protein-S-isoprenylcysteine O-methyltransferase Ste14